MIQRIGILLAAFGVAATTASAQQRATPKAPRRASAAPAANPGPQSAAHQFGAGVRAYPESAFGIGGGIRYFMGGPLGFQAEIARLALPGFRFDDLSATQFSAAVLYRIKEYKFTAPLALVPYAGGGLNFVTGDCEAGGRHLCVDDKRREFDNNSVGGILLGGAELFFRKVPKLSASGEISITTNNELFNGGAHGTIAAHWYFK
jgi:hypothetical protein